LENLIIFFADNARDAVFIHVPSSNERKEWRKTGRKT